MLLILVLGRQRQADLSELEASLFYKPSFRIPRTLSHRKPVAKNKNKTKKRLRI